MPKTKISEFSATPGNNTDIDGINIAEGCAPSGINDAIRELMAQLKDFQAGTAGDSFNGPVGTSTAAAGAFTTLTTSSTVTHNGGTANGVAYLNGSKVLTTGSALSFDGTNFGVGASPLSGVKAYFASQSGNNTVRLDCGPGGSSISDLTFGAYGFSAVAGLRFEDANALLRMYGDATRVLAFNANGSEQMRLTSTGLGIGEASPDTRLHIYGASAAGRGQFYIQGSGTTSRFVMADSADAYSLNTYGDSSTSLLTWDTNSGYSFRWTIFDSEQMRLTSTGLGIGTSSPGAKLDVVTSSGDCIIRLGNGTSQARFAVDSDGPYIYPLTSGDLSLRVFTPAGGTAATIDSSGNLGLGVTNPGGGSRLHVDASGGGIIRVTRLASSATAYGQLENDGTNTTLTSSAALLFNAGGSTERARITSGGQLLINTTDSGIGGTTQLVVKGPATNTQQVAAFWNPATTATQYFLSFGTNTTYTERGYITWNGTTTAIANASDQRLKTNIVDAPSALAKVDAIKIRSFDFIADNRHIDYGVIAQELETVIPAAVFKGSDNEDGSIDKPWSVGLEPIIPVLVKAIQEQQAIITDLRARVAALETK